MECLSDQLYRLASYYLNRPELEPCTLLGDSFSQIAFDYHEQDIKMWCSAGTKMVSYDTDGESYPCQMFMPLSCGSHKALAAKKIHFSESIPDSFLDVKCRTCVAKRACPSCYGSSYIENGSLYSKSDSYCTLIQTVLLARSYFMARRWKLGQLKLSELEEAALLKSILLIQEAFAPSKSSQ